MLGLEVSVNGKRLCIATAENVVSTIVSWADRDPNRINFHVGGIPATREGEHIEWDTPRLAIGDIVTIRIIEADLADPPGRRYKPAEGNRRETAE
jgi:hypothetical protein